MLHEKVPRTLALVTKEWMTSFDFGELEKAEKLGKRVLGKDDLYALISTSYRALAYMEQEQLEKVGKLLADLLEAVPRVLKKGHPQIIIALSNLTPARRSPRELEIVERLEEVLKAIEGVVADNHPVTGDMGDLVGRRSADSVLWDLAALLNGKAVQSNRRISLDTTIPGPAGHDACNQDYGKQDRPAVEADRGATYTASGTPSLFGIEQPRGISEHTSKRPISLSGEVCISQATNANNTAEIKGNRGAATVKAELDQQEKKRVYPVQADSHTIKLWQEKLLPQLEKILERHLPKTESASIDLLGIGTSRETSRPTIVVTCESVRQVKVHLRKRFTYDEDKFDLKIRKGSVRRSTGRRAREKRNAIRRSTGSFHQDCPNRAYQPQPLSGASIGAFLDGRPLPPGTYGGLILVDGQPYGINTQKHTLSI